MKTLRTLPALLCAGFLGLSAQAAEDSRSGPLAGSANDSSATA